MSFILDHLNFKVKYIVIFTKTVSILSGLIIGMP